MKEEKEYEGKENGQGLQPGPEGEERCEDLHSFRQIARLKIAQQEYEVRKGVVEKELKTLADKILGDILQGKVLLSLESYHRLKAELEAYNFILGLIADEFAKLKRIGEGAGIKDEQKENGNANPVIEIIPVRDWNIE